MDQNAAKWCLGRSLLTFLGNFGQFDRLLLRLVSKIWVVIAVTVVVIKVVL